MNVFNKMKSYIWLLYIIVINSYFPGICSNKRDVQILSLCTSQGNCDNCLRASSLCAWCSDWSFSNSSIGGKARCNLADRLRAFGCPDEEIRTASPGSLDILTNLDFQDVFDDSAPVQLKPQKLRLKIRPGTSEVVTIQYRPAKNYPLDLYYLMDLTWSMKDDKETLVELGWDLAYTLDNFTTNFRIGFGSYADKPLMPFAFPGHTDNPCKSEHSTCAPLYSFWHHLELTKNVSGFIHEVNSSSVTGNIDNLEGGLDGVMQAILCAKEVGWVDQARKVMLLATDGLLHTAGDGKLAGVILRPDFQCHLDKSGQYHLATKYDYPSLADIFRLLKDYKINLIFAVTEDRYQEYEKIANLLEEHARVATLTRNSSNILEIIKNAYHDIITKVVLRDNSTSPLHFKYFSTCGRYTGLESQTSECNGVQEGQMYEFKIIVSVDECPKDKSLWKQTVIIDDALASEASEVQIEVEFACGCDCKNIESSYCKNGVNECGICKCNIGWSGETCDCDQTSSTDNQLQCISPNSTEICSKRGECVCNTCICDKGYKGQFCECLPCDKANGIECGGNGTCDCGTCNCFDGWEGNACQCPTNIISCIAPGSNEICGGHGYCDCGHCRCNVTAADGLYYRGTYCESSASAGGSDLCILYDSCVNATVEYPEKAEELCQTNTTLYKTVLVDTVNADDEHYCFLKQRNDRSTCIIPYIYEFRQDKTVLLTIANKVCHTRLHAAIIPAIAFGSVLITGIIGLVIWKGITSMQDHKEYVKFERERKRTVYALDMNPLYRPATTKFRVPSVYREV